MGGFISLNRSVQARSMGLAFFLADRDHQAFRDLSVPNLDMGAIPPNSSNGR